MRKPSCSFLLLLVCAACSRSPQTATSLPTEPVGSPMASSGQTGSSPQTIDSLYAYTCNGKVSTARYADIAFRSSGLVTAVYKKNGDRVAAGEKIAQLETLEQEKALRQSETALQQAALEMQDILIGQGFDPDKQEQVPAEMMRLIRIKSGYEQAELNLQAARYSLQEATLKAPFAGVVANMAALPHNAAPTSSPVCRIIDDRALEVEFRIQENQLATVRQGDEVEVLLYGGVGEVLKAKVSEINPLVEDDNSVKVKARLGQDPRLLAGMNVQVRINPRP